MVITYCITQLILGSRFSEDHGRFDEGSGGGTPHSGVPTGRSIRFGSQSSAPFALSFWRQTEGKWERSGGGGVEGDTCKVFLTDVELSPSILQAEFLLFRDLIPRKIRRFGGRMLSLRRTFETLRSCSSYLVWVNGTSAYEATTMIITNGTPNRRGFLRSVLLRGVMLSGLESNTPMTASDTSWMKLKVGSSLSVCG